jgi:hypothetical protein
LTAPFQSFDSLKLTTVSSFRAVLLVKLVQILKLKKNCSKAVADFFLQLLNTEGSIVASPEVSHSIDFTKFIQGEDFFTWFHGELAAKNVVLSEKEHFIIQSQAHLV